MSEIFLGGVGIFPVVLKLSLVSGIERFFLVGGKVVIFPEA